MPLLVGAAAAASLSGTLPRWRLSVDGEFWNTEAVLRALDRLPPSTRAYGTGSTSLAPLSFHRSVRRGAEAASAGELRFAYVWTVDSARQLGAYIADGAQLVITNRPRRAREVAARARARGARPGPDAEDPPPLERR